MKISSSSSDRRTTKYAPAADVCAHAYWPYPLSITSQALIVTDCTQELGIEHLHLPTVDFLFAPGVDDMLRAVMFIQGSLDRMCPGTRLPATAEGILKCDRSGCTR